ncbi:hypothetical protein FB567DRAFT_591380 [Paraphoma chrysanthemicola]|uniref:BTB domain-containing protein n=1 Tax=Paraphoma chrysanthemicola TaxID=798071 RepID=A0A8K0R9Y2_9PLEO|nr:hypothetical protein FB567DRAFT_591380 [Paraphoma chrysanthemicola]
MLNFFKKSAFTTKGLDVWVGKPPSSIKVHVAGNILSACPSLRRRLYQDATIVNADPIVFEIALEYLGRNCSFGKMLTRNPLEKLVGSSDMMLKLAKSWHLAGILEIPEMQNKIIDTFSACYKRFLNVRQRMPLSREPFEYLRDHIGYYTKCEKFLIDFYAGLARYGGPFLVERLQELPEDIAQELQHRREEFMSSGQFTDYIFQGSLRFKVGKADNTLQAELQVRSSSVASLRSRAPSAPTRPGLARSSNSRSTLLSNPTPTTTIANRRRNRLSLPLLSDLGRNPERAVTRALQPALQSVPAPRSRRPQTQPRSVSMPLLGVRAPFMSPTRTRRSHSMLEAEESSTDEESD